MSEDVPSIKELGKSNLKKVPQLYPEGVRFSKKWKLFKTGWAGVVLIIIGLIFVGYGMSLPPKHYWAPVDNWSKSWTIQPGEEWYQSWTFRNPAGTMFEINVSVSGGNNDIRVYVDTPSGRLDYGKLKSPIHIKLNVSEYGAGKYVVHFDNSFSIVTAKTVWVRETVYKLREDTSDSDAMEVIGMLFFVIPGLILILMGIRKVATLVVDDDTIEAKLVYGGKLELKVNGYKLDQKLDHDVKFKAGRDESRIVELKREKFRNTFFWRFLVDGREVGRLP
uniref:T26-19p n=1 Tax=Thermococcus sp. 26/2 TaxID=758583 RepID=D6MY42_9EURY|nr:t26-19p [Thermococcus sp. 26/2]